MNRYLVSYLDVEPGQISHGSVEITLTSPVSSMSDVRMLTDTLRKTYGLTNPVVMGFSRFAEPGENGAPR